MSINYQSSQSSTAGTNLVIAKPTSLAVDDYMVAGIHHQNNITSVPSGWSQLTTIANGGGGTLRVYYIKATSTEVSATDFTWVADGNFLCGGIVRLTGDFHSTPFAVYGQDDEVSTVSPTYTTTVTPNNANSLLLYFVGATVSTGIMGGTSVSNYAVTTSNPSWTEAFDVTTNIGSNGDIQCSMAYATRPQITATGNSTATISGARSSSAVIVVCRPKILVTISDTLVLVDSLKKVIRKTISSTLSLVDTLTTGKSRKWTKRTKPTTTWTKKIK